MSDQEHVLHRPDRELLQSMMVELNLYRSGRSRFASLVSALDVGINVLVGQDPAFVNEFREKWRILEEINALALDEGKVYPLEPERPLAEETIRELSTIIETRFAMAAGERDP
ncbi:MAG: hypothetical protein AAGD38_18900 [Acidobacteriota bacterium]